MKTLILALIFASAVPAFAQNLVNVDPASNCMSERTDLTNTINSMTPTTQAASTCKMSYVKAVDCCNGNGDGCAVTSATSVDGSSMKSANTSIGNTYSAGAAGLAANANICEQKFNSATCTATTYSESAYQKNVYNKYLALQKCFSDKQVALNAQAVKMATNSDGVSSGGIQNALNQGVQQADATPTDTSAGNQQAMNCFQKLATTAMVACSFATGNPQGVSQLKQPAPIESSVKVTGP